MTFFDAELRFCLWASRFQHVCDPTTELLFAYIRNQYTQIFFPGTFMQK